MEPIEGTISPKHQITIPAPMRDALGWRPGNKIEFKLEAGNVLQLRVKRPKPSETVNAVLEQFDLGQLQEESGGDAVRAVREARWGEE
jgi:AbrB family looped-hinge helix DNA binding protein